MFVYHTHVRLKDTDVTGVLYFTEQFRMAQEALEEFLKERGFPLRQLLDSPYLMPIVHARGDYFAPLTVGDELEISLKVVKLGTSSVTLEFTFHDPDRKFDVGKVQIVHVVMDKEKRVPIPIPDFIRTILIPESAIHLDFLRPPFSV
ncbi:MAG: thioesterase family protein [Rhabdochlamydiaceae bacterium]|jgi:YbgC/YbaW family acyl-CoA thioester hydrolase